MVWAFLLRRRLGNQRQGNPAPDFKTIIQPIKGKSVDDILKRLHTLIDGKKGAAVGAVIMKAKTDGYLTGYPTRAQFTSEFKLQGTWQAISNYFNENGNKCLSKASNIIIF